MKKLALLSFLILATFASRAQQQPSFQLSAAAKRKLAGQAVTLKAGDSFQTVTNALGVPSFDQPLLSQDNHGTVGRELRYFAVIWPGADESQNELVDVTLDKAGRVRSVYIRITLK